MGVNSFKSIEGTITKPETGRRLQHSDIGGDSVLYRIWQAGVKNGIFVKHGFFVKSVKVFYSIYGAFP